MMHELNKLDLLIVISVFVLIAAIWMMAVLAWQMKRAAHQAKIVVRLESQQDSEMRELRLWRDGKEATLKVPKAISPQLMERLDSLRQEAGINMPLSSFFLSMLGIMALTAVFVQMAMSMLLLSLTAAAAVAMVIWVWIGARIAKGRALFEKQFVEALELAARSLRAGHPLIGSFRVISEEIGAPVGPLFAKICQQQTMGLSLENAIREASESCFSEDMKLFATSVAIQLSSGGNLADMMDRLALVVRERMRLSRRIRVLTAQTDLSKRILMGLPVLMFVVLNIINPTYMQPLYETTFGKWLIALAAIGVVLGAWTMNLTARIKY
jgi:tight adherence protein B